LLMYRMPYNSILTLLFGDDMIGLSVPLNSGTREVMVSG